MESGEPSFERRFDAKFFVVFLLCLAGAGGSSYLLYRDFTAAGGAGKGKPMAKIDRMEGSVRRKPANTYIWANGHESEDLYKKDAIQTSASSAATVKLADGSLIEMGENSLIIIDDLSDMSLNFLRGQMVLRKADGSDSKVSIGSDGKAKLETLAVRLVKPDPLARLFYHKAESRDIELSWSMQSGRTFSSVQVQISKDRSFNQKNTQSFPVDQGISTVKTSLHAGQYFWRVVADGSPQSESRQFQVISIPSLKSVSPIGGQKIFLLGDQTGVQFRWSNPQGPELDDWGNHELEIASDAGFAQIVKKERVAASGGSATFKGLPDGLLYWRLKSQYGDLQVSTGIEKFSVERTEKLAFELNQPEENAIYSVGAPIRFSWNIDAQGLDFLWTLESRPIEGEQSQVVKQVRTKAFAYELKEPEPGNYRWKVQAFYEKQSVGETAYRNLSISLGKNIALRTPENNSNVLFWSPDVPAKFKFTWDKDSHVKVGPYYYKLEVSKDPEFKVVSITAKLKESELDSAKIKNMQPGDYYWRVQIFDRKEQSVRKSEVWKFTYAQHPLLRLPASYKPEPGTKFSLVALDPNEIVATWEPVEGAVSYQVVVTERPASKDGKLGAEKVILKTQTKETTITLKELGVGYYRWIVRPVDQIGRPGQPIQGEKYPDFIINFGDPLPAPETTSPEVQ
ncbi:MAG: hypothetical protein AB7F43_04680 [Bacteriovoracia bacterium]